MSQFPDNNDDDDIPIEQMLFKISQGNPVVVDLCKEIDQADQEYDSLQ